MIIVTFTGNSIQGSKDDIKKLKKKLNKYNKIIHGTHKEEYPLVDIDEKSFKIDLWEHTLFAIQSLEGVRVQYEVPRSSKKKTIADYSGTDVFDLSEREELALAEHNYISQHDAIKLQIKSLNEAANIAKDHAVQLRTQINQGYRNKEFSGVDIIYDGDNNVKVYMVDETIVGHAEMTETDMRNFKQNGEMKQVDAFEN